MRWSILRIRSGHSKVAPGRWAHNQTTKQREHRGAGRPVLLRSTALTSYSWCPLLGRSGGCIPPPSLLSSSQVRRS